MTCMVIAGVNEINLKRNKADCRIVRKTFGNPRNDG